MQSLKKVIVIGLDGLEPTIVEPMLEAGQLPALASLRAAGGYSRVRTTTPAQTPVAWSTFATGTNPGGHGIFDFIRRDPETYSPLPALNQYQQKNSFLPPRVTNLRRGVPLWDLLSRAGHSSTVLRCPCTYPPDPIRGRMLSGMGVPDLRGGLGTPTFYSSNPDVTPGEGEQVVRLLPDADGRVKTHLVGPRNPRGGSDHPFPLTIQFAPQGRRLLIHSGGQPGVLEVREGAWSDWLRVKFKTGMLQSVHGAVRFYLNRLNPWVELYASPLNFDADAPPFPISAPPSYAGELASRLGPYYTAGMVEEHSGVTNGRLSEDAFLDQCAAVLRERERMMLSELERSPEGFFFCLFDTPDRLQHLFWRYREPDHPANRDAWSDDCVGVIEEHYRACDAVVSEALHYADDETLFIVLSDHGFNSFQRGVNLNTWLHSQGLLTLRGGMQPGDRAGDFLRHVDWPRTRAYALGLSGIYLNVQGRERQGVVAPTESPTLCRAMARELTGLSDPARGRTAVRRVVTREEAFVGPYSDESPDLVVHFASGFRSSWGTALGGVAEEVFEDNVKKWSGDHLIDPELVPGVLFMNRPFRGEAARLLDLAPTVLGALGVPKGAAMEGESLL